MSALRALMSRGAQGVAAEPVVFAAFAPPKTPNWCLAAPPGDDLPAQLRAPVFAASAEETAEALLAVAAAEPRAFPLGQWPAARQFQWVARTRLMNYPDVVAAEIVPLPGGTSVRLYSRSLLGHSDLGVNRARLGRWLGALRARLPLAGPSGASERAEVPPPPAEDPDPPLRAFSGPPLEAALSALAPGRRVAFAWDDAGEVAGLLLHSLAAGASRALVVHPNRPNDADARLRVAAEQQARLALAEEVLERAPCAADGGPIPAHANTSRPRPWWLLAPLEAPDLAARIGGADVVVDGAGLMQWWADPPRRLRDLASTGAERLLLRTAAIPVSPALAAVGFASDSLWFASRLDEAKAAALDATLRDHGVGLPQFGRFPGAMAPAAAAEAGMYGAWIWFMAEGGVSRLLDDAGWRLERVWPDRLFPVFEAARA